MRGTQNIEIIDNLADGIIPACAGNTGGWQLLVGRHGDHPRVCGEHSTSMMYGVACAGSSPRVRGTRRVHSRPHGADGIIPACAGNTTHDRPGAWSRGDHPRVCGEHSRPASSASNPSGSSPRVRGTQANRGHEMNRNGIIPACAGNTIPAVWRVNCARDHPRVCGEHLS